MALMMLDLWVCGRSGDLSGRCGPYRDCGAAPGEVADNRLWLAIQNFMASQRRPLLDDSNLLIDAIPIDPAVFNKPVPVAPICFRGHHAFGKCLRGLTHHDFFTGAVWLPNHSAKELFPWSHVWLPVTDIPRDRAGGFLLRADVPMPG